MQTSWRTQQNQGQEWHKIRETVREFPIALPLLSAANPGTELPRGARGSLAVLEA